MRGADQDALLGAQGKCVDFPFVASEVPDCLSRRYVGDEELLVCTRRRKAPVVLENDNAVDLIIVRTLVRLHVQSRSVDSKASQCYPATHSRHTVHSS